MPIFGNKIVPKHLQFSFVWNCEGTTALPAVLKALIPQILWVLSKGTTGPPPKSPINLLSMVSLLLFRTSKGLIRQRQSTSFVFPFHVALTCSCPCIKSTSILESFLLSKQGRKARTNRPALNFLPNANQSRRLHLTKSVRTITALRFVSPL